MDPSDLVRLKFLMNRTRGDPNVGIGLIDGPVLARHAEINEERLRNIPGSRGAACAHSLSAACIHGTFIAGILCAKRSSSTPGICPDCTLFVRPIFGEQPSNRDPQPTAEPQDLAKAIVECLDAGVRIINLSLGLARPSTRNEKSVEDALDRALSRGVIVVAAAGNQSAVGGSAIIRHPWVVPVVACDMAGAPMSESNLGGSIGRRGVSAPGDGVQRLSAVGRTLNLRGTSVAAAFVTGVIALLWSVFPHATSAEIIQALTQGSVRRRTSVVPPLLNAAISYRTLLATSATRQKQ